MQERQQQGKSFSTLPMYFGLSLKKKIIVFVFAFVFLSLYSTLQQRDSVANVQTGCSQTS